MYNMKMVNFTRRGVYSVAQYSTSKIPKPDVNPKLPNRKLFLNNEWVDSLEPGNYFNVINPTTGKPITEIQMSCKNDVDRAVDAAKKAFHHNSPWRKMDAPMRAKLLFKLADLVERDSAYLTSLDTLEVGKLYLYGRYDSLFSQSVLRYMAGFADKLFGSTMPGSNNTLCYTKYEPIGVCGLLSAWNYSLSFQAGKLASSLAAGNVVLVKPSNTATLSVLHLIELTKEAGFPPGVIGMLPGNSQVGEMIIDHEGIECISFTGSTEVGQHIYQKGAKHIRRNILELSGKSASIICDDVNLDEAVLAAHKAIFTNSGQCCCACSRTYVQDTIYEKFLEKSIALTKARILGDPFDFKTSQGPQANEETLRNNLKMVEIGKAEGGTIATGGKRYDREGFFMEPTIFTDVNDNMTLAKEEIFGPVQLIMPFKTLDEVIDRTNNSQYGLASIFYSRNINNIREVTERIRTGSVWINTYHLVTPQAPFGGYKQSGLNRECGYSSMLAFSEEKCVQIRSLLQNN